jgi:DNA-binding transcriptional ArsR family regulator
VYATEPPAAFDPGLFLLSTLALPAMLTACGSRPLTQVAAQSSVPVFASRSRIAFTPEIIHTSKIPLSNHFFDVTAITSNSCQAACNEHVCIVIRACEPMLTEAMTEVVARRFRALGEPMRLRILQVLQDGEKPVSEIVGIMEASQPNISKHLKALCEEGLVNRRRKGLNICYSIADPMVFQLCDLICRDAAERTRAQLAEFDAVFRSRQKKSSR